MYDVDFLPDIHDQWINSVCDVTDRGIGDVIGHGDHRKTEEPGKKILRFFVNRIWEEFDTEINIVNSPGLRLLWQEYNTATN